MSLAPHQIDLIVGEVVRRLKEIAKTSAAPASLGATAGLSSSAAPKPTSKGGTGSLPASVVPQRSTELIVADPVITLQSLAGRLTGMQKLVVRPKAIVTPAVRDELKQNNIQLERRAGNLSSIGQVRLLVVAADPAAEKEVTKLKLAGSERIESQATTSLSGTLQELARHMQTRHLPALVVSSQPFAAAVEANRHTGIRAALVHTLEQVQQATVEAAANLFIVAAKTNPFTLRNIGERIASGSR